MARGKLAFKKNDVKRAVCAVTAAGQSVQRVEIDREGKIVVFVGIYSTARLVIAGYASEDFGAIAHRARR